MNHNHITPTYPWYNPSRISAWRSTGEGKEIAQVLIKNRPLIDTALFDIEFSAEEVNGAGDEIVVDKSDVDECDVDLAEDNEIVKESETIASEEEVIITENEFIITEEEVTTASEESKTFDVIETFLKCDNLKIVADEKGTIRGEVTIEVELEDIDDLVTEELAEIYIAQGLIEEGKSIYIKLSLLNSEKSVYFAELIENIDKNQEIE